MNHGLGLERFPLCPCARLCLPSLELGAACVRGRVLCDGAAKRFPAPAIYANATMGEEVPHLLPAGDLQGVLGGGGDPRTAHVDLLAVGLSSTTFPLCCAPKFGHIVLLLGAGGKSGSGATSFYPGEMKPGDVGAGPWNGFGPPPQGTRGWRGSPGSEKMFVFFLSPVWLLSLVSPWRALAHSTAEQIASSTANGLLLGGEKIFS